MDCNNKSSHDRLMKEYDDCPWCIIDELRAELEQYKSYVGSNMYMSDFRTVDDIRKALTNEKKALEMACEAINNAPRGLPILPTYLNVPADYFRKKARENGR